MLRRLTIQGFGLLADVTLELSNGLNVLTGETGAGKSMVLAALALLAGGPVPREASPARIEAELDLRALPQESLAELGRSPGVIPVTRSLLGNARSRASIDGAIVPVAELRTLVRAVLSLTTQHAVAEIASRDGVLGVLDARAGLAPLAARLRAGLGELARMEQELAALSNALGANALERVELAASIEQLANVDPRAGEYAELGQRIELQSRSQDYLELAQRVSVALFERESAIEAELGGLLQQVRRAPSLPVLERLAEALAQALGALEQAGREASRLAEELSFEPMALARLEERFDAITRLSQRLKVAPDALSAHRDTLQDRLAELEGFAARRESLERERDAARVQAEKLAAELGVQRARALPALQRELEGELRVLAMPSARLVLALQPAPGTLGVRGLETLSLGFSANAGCAPLPLARVASGGERSRIALALCCVGAARGRTLVFDEIDQGVGGEAVLAVAERMQRLASTQQIVCVTHQAAIAARADAQFIVRKRAAGGSTTTAIREVTGEERTLELSRMLSGGKAPNASRALARRLLEASQRAA